MILVSGSHDSSIYLWDIASTRQCVQELHCIGENLMRVYYVLNIINLYYGWQVVVQSKSHE
ncbi:hypothetical protein C2G38_2095475 [Gigaspora rosea]|uniref:Uncharacterized protein n=1 Tax=Gigaspora rosea TaxID=44941 RepID=A0A397UXX1_9GLOM|nr:hypothetical protein C2G38_2095475 [Gigaspora rosea]